MSTQKPRDKTAADRTGSDETRKMAVMNAWLDEVCAELGVDRDLLSATTPPILRLISKVAHGPSRPGAPLTAFAVGLAAAGAAGDTDARSAAVVERVDAVSALVARWAERQADDVVSGDATAGGTDSQDRP